MASVKKASVIRVRVLGALVILLVAIFAYRAERDVDLIKVKPCNFAAEHAALNSPMVREVDAIRRLTERMGNTFDEAAALYLTEARTPEQRRRGALPLEAYIAERTSGRALRATEPEWVAWFGNFPAGTGWDDRVTDAFGIRSYLFRPDEEPIRRVADQIPRGETYWLRAADGWYEAYRLAEEQTQGDETGLQDGVAQWNVPAHWTHPWRSWSPWLLFVSMLVLVVPSFLPRATLPGARGAAGQPEFRNPERRVASIAAILTLAAAGVCFLPLWPRGSGMAGGFAVRVVAGFLALMGSIVVLFYIRRAAQWDGLIAGDGRLAHWTYNEEEWARFAVRDRARDRARTRALLVVMAVFFVVIGGGMWLYDREGGGLTFAVLMVLLALIAVLGRAAVVARARAARGSAREAYLSLTCAWVGGQFHSWTSMGARLESARTTESDPMEIEIEYSVPGRYSRSSWTFRLPVPGGQEDDAGRIAGELRRTTAGG